jgi:hypothetical protein
MKATNIQTVKLNIINKIGMSEDNSLLQKVWDIISSNETNEHKENVLVKKDKAKTQEFVVPQWQQDLVLNRIKNAKTENYSSINNLDQEIRLQK